MERVASTRPAALGRVVVVRPCPPVWGRGRYRGFAASLAACFVATAWLHAAGAGDFPFPSPAPLLSPLPTSRVGPLTAAPPTLKNQVPAEQVKPRADAPLPGPLPLSFPVGGCPYPTEGEAAAPGSTPLPTKEVQEEFSQFIEERVDPQNTLDLIVGRQTLLRLKQAAKKIQLPDEKIAAYDPITPKEIAVTGKVVGSTVLNLWFTDPKDPTKDTVLSYLVRVHHDPEEARLAAERRRLLAERQEAEFRLLQGQINAKFPDSVVRLSLLNDKLLVCGQVKDGFEAQQILRVIGLNVAEKPPEAVAQVGLNVNVNPATNVGPNGAPAVNSPPGGLADFLIETPTGERFPVVNLLRVPGEQQVMLKVEVAEINRTAARSIGVNFEQVVIGNNVFASTVGNIAGQTVNAAVSGTGATTPGGAGGAASAANNLPMSIDNGRVVAAVDALKNLDFARSLAEPTLTALNGQTASSQVGGQFPVSVVTGFTGAGLQGVSFVPFGVQMNFTPYISDKDLIRLQMSVDVSTREPGLTPGVGGAAGTPGLNTRNFQTTVELRSGQTLAVGGLIQNNFGVDSTRVPFFGELPVFGRLFAFDRTAAGEQELVVLVTPVLVHPLDAGECLPLPGSDVFEPGDFEFYVLGRLESRRPYDFRSPVMTDLNREARYHRCEQVFIFGPQGRSGDQP